MEFHGQRSASLKNAPSPSHVEDRSSSRWGMELDVLGAVSRPLTGGPCCLHLLHAFLFARAAAVGAEHQRDPAPA